MKVKQDSTYVCTNCSSVTERSGLSVKRSVFLTFGRNPKVIRSRVVAWLCDDCRESDPDWERDDARGGPPTAPKGE